VNTTDLLRKLKSIPYGIALQFLNMDGSVRKPFLRPVRPAQAMSQVEMTIPSEPKRSRQSTACTSYQKKRKRVSEFIDAMDSLSNML
jgi:hypothetical protein